VCNPSVEIATCESDDHPRAQTQPPPLRVRSHWMEQQIQTSEDERRSVEETVAPGTTRTYKQELDDITRDARQSREEVRGLRTQYECLDVSSQGGSGCSPGPGRQRPEISRLPGLFRIGSNSVERLIAHLRMVIRHSPQLRRNSRKCGMHSTA